MSSSCITPSELGALLQQGRAIELIDVRTPAEFRSVHVSVARNVPLDQLDPTAVMQSRKGASGEPLYVVCHAGSRSLQACAKFEQAGFTNVVNVEGGTKACVAAGLPVERGKAALSLDRQMRMVAGSLVVIGAALAWWVNPAFIGLSAFVGAGLIFAGATDICPMIGLLARMPWNNCSDASGSCCTK